MVVNPESEYLKELPNHLRSFDDVLAYIPNQVYIGNMTNKELAATEFPWYDKDVYKRQVLKALEMMNDGHNWIVDIDLAKFFDTVDHDKMMTIFGRTIKDGRCV